MIGKRNPLQERLRTTGPGKLALIYPAAFLVSVAVGFVIFGLTFFARDVLRFEPGQIGMLVGTWPLTYCISCLLIRPIFGQVPPRFLMIGSCATMCLAVAALLSFPVPRAVFPLFGLFGFALGLFWTPVMGWLSVGQEGKTLSRLISHFNFSWGTGNMISPFLCGWLYRIRPGLPLLSGAALLFAVAVYVTWGSVALPRIRADRSSGVADENPVDTDQSTTLRYPAWAGLWANYFGIGLLNAVFPLAGRIELGMDSAQVGFAFLLLNLLNVVVFLALGRWEAWHFQSWPMKVSTGLRILLFILLMAVGDRISSFAIMALIGIPYAIAYSSSVFHGCSGTIHRARRMAIHEGVLTAAMVMGSISGGYAYQHLSAGAAYLMCAGINAATLGLQVWMGPGKGRPDSYRAISAPI